MSVLGVSGMSIEARSEKSPFKLILCSPACPGWKNFEICNSAANFPYGVSLQSNSSTHGSNEVSQTNSWVIKCLNCSLTGAPCFELSLIDSVAKLGQNAKLVCNVTGVPKPVVTWYKGNIFSFAVFSKVLERETLPLDCPFPFQMALLWKMTSITLSQKETQVLAIWFWLRCPWMIRVSTCAMRRTPWGTLAPWPR